jgi:hypothetical protein
MFDGSAIQVTHLRYRSRAGKQSLFVGGVVSCSIMSHSFVFLYDNVPGDSHTAETHCMINNNWAYLLPYYLPSVIQL